MSIGRIRNAFAKALLFGATLGLTACAGASVDWEGMGRSAAHTACKNSSHCDLPCSRDPRRPDCVTGTRP